MNSLREQQEGFARSIVRGVDKDYAQTILDNGLNGARRLGLYHHGVSIGFSDVLSDVYEATKKIVGDNFFAYVTGEYVRSHPSRTGNVHDFGETFPQYLGTFPGLEGLPYLPDVARLEWSYHAAFHSPISEMLNIEKLAQVPESQYEQLTLLLSPACYLLQSSFPILRIWQVNQDAAFKSDSEGDEMVNLDEGGVELVIIREGKQIAFHSLESGAYAMLKAISNGKTFNVCCEEALNADADCDVSTILQDAVINRMVVGFSLS